MGPLLFDSTYISPIWAGTRISQIRGLQCDATHNNGEAFDVSAHEGVMSVVRNGPHAGTPLARLIAEHHDELIGDLPDDAVVQVTFMDPIADLSVQVHPDEGYAARVEHDHGKTESWYILHAEPDATLIAGSTTDDVEALREAATDDTIGPRYGNRIEMHTGDFILIPTGTMHALGAGLFAVEVGSFGNNTYRICDWGRGRPLQVEKAFDVLRTQNRPSINHLGEYDENGSTMVREGVSAGLFDTKVLDVCGEWHTTKGGTYQILTCVGGEAEVKTDEGDVSLPYTASTLIPASVREVSVRGNCRIIQSYRTI